MKSDDKILDLIFRQIPPERILSRLCNWNDSFKITSAKNVYEEEILRFAETVFPGYSQDEQRLIYTQMVQRKCEKAKELNVPESDFLLLSAFGMEVFTIHGTEPYCRFEETLRWREIYLLFGQDLLICAYLACLDAQHTFRRIDFSWPACIRTDNSSLNGILKNGISENHYHLNGSSQSFPISWCALMNDPRSFEKWPKDFTESLQSTISRGPEDNVMSAKDRVQVASLVRTILFRALHRKDFISTSKCESAVPFSSAAEFDLGYRLSFSMIGYLTETVQALRSAYGAKINLPGSFATCLDYALEGSAFQTVADFPYRILVGERLFLYGCFLACYRGDFTDFEQELFHLYIVLKTAFRGEFIQINKQVGFRNFANYQDRKDLFWDQSIYQWDAYRIAINAPLAMGSVSTLESRFCPSKTAEGTINKVALFDKAKKFADIPYQNIYNTKEYQFNLELEAGAFKDERYFYVVHFPKRHDDEVKSKDKFMLKCRHSDLRNDLKNRAIELSKALAGSEYLCNRIRGVDGCANEVDCRPEVFATAFRFLKNGIHSRQSAIGAMLSPPRSRLSASYHVGEDFYDIVDGLRAIDEAVSFLGLQRGDRLGHALALGVDPEMHYRTKSRSIVLPQQNYLDNLVWLLFRCRQLGVYINPQQYGIIKEEAIELLRKIYGKAIQKQKWSVSLQEYFYSMQLRGDAPELYESLSFRNDNFYDSQYELYRVNSEVSSTYRDDYEIAGMYYYYQYGYDEKIEGAKTISVDITPEYVTLVRQVQDVMQNYLERKGLIVECNPTSNVLIGTFKEYSAHPVFRFNNRGLESGSVVNKNCPQMHVCINTDDLGVFDTSLEFEYALLFATLSKETDSEGNLKYSENDILNYLQNLQMSGLRAVFPTP